ncbi:peptidoglycan-binding domain-containing protein [Myxacorys almedinensis]|uniref:Peptidoglycan-binding protein n=1 Tax=Myxacorys almedinensis A TaxID=2690445 RepID=A0A8J7YZY3_9CYAN|nr:peptidoglycan-binding protein [Myxacorys almedinensis]NDJ17617.1 peptidoglycan-binding protein [Myxacorys almedinensis A]
MEFPRKLTAIFVARLMHTTAKQAHWQRYSLLVGVLIASCLVPTAALSQIGGVTRSLLREGSQGAEVTELQSTLTLLGFFNGAVDGVFGNNTAEAVTRFQQAAGVEQDGIVGQATWNRLFPPTSISATLPAPSQPSTPSAPANPAPTPYPILRRGARGAAVIGLQSRLRAIGVFSGEVDGVFGDETLAGVEEAQRQLNLEPDGIVGPSTWEALLR